MSETGTSVKTTENTYEKKPEKTIKEEFKEGRSCKLPKSIVFWVAIVVMGLLVLGSFRCLYIWINDQQKSSFDVVGAMFINSLVACVGFVAIYINVANDRRMKQFEYIKDYNFQFLTQSEFIKVERALESCNELYQKLK